MIAQLSEKGNLSQLFSIIQRKTEYYYFQRNSVNFCLVNLLLKHFKASSEMF